MVLIKNMNKPAGCGECRLKDNYFKECNVTHKKIHTWIDTAHELPKWCPLIEVEPYGPEGTLYKER